MPQIYQLGSNMSNPILSGHKAFTMAAVLLSCYPEIIFPRLDIHLER